MVLEICEKYPEYIFIIIHTKSPKLKLTKNKFMVNKDTTVAEFIRNLRLNNHIEVNKHQSIFLFVDNVLPRPTEYLEVLRKKYRDKDGLLHINVEIENTFG